MEHLAPLRNSIFSLALLLSACGHSKPAGRPLTLDLATADVEVRNGLYFHNKQPFSGCLFALQGNKRDTLFSDFFKDGKENGLYKKWYPGGNLSEKRIFENGLKTGLHEGFWENGNPRFRYHFVKDLYEGAQCKWYEDGSPYTRKNYKNGQEDGMQQEWDRQGKLTINYQAIHGRQYGNIGKKNCASIWMDSVYSKPRR